MRNWDYRYCWVRDASFTLYTLLVNGYEDEALAWREWLLRAVAGGPSQLNILYGVAGERRLPELELDWLAGYEDSQAGADRQRRLPAVPARRVRRVDGSLPPGPLRGTSDGRRRLARAANS